MTWFYKEELAPLLALLRSGLKDRSYEFGENTDDPTSLLLQHLIAKLNAQADDHLRVQDIPPILLDGVDRQFIYTLLTVEHEPVFHQVMTDCQTSKRIDISLDQGDGTDAS